MLQSMPAIETLSIREKFLWTPVSKDSVGFDPMCEAYFVQEPSKELYDEIDLKLNELKCGLERMEGMRYNRDIEVYMYDTLKKQIKDLRACKDRLSELF